jgi:hypothetical protein
MQREDPYITIREVLPKSIQDTNTTYRQLKDGYQTGSISTGQ